MSAWPVLTAVRDALATIDGVKTCKVGMEANITPDDYPLVRIVPSTVTDPIVRGPATRVDALIYFGVPLHEFEDGLESVYEHLLEMQGLILTKSREPNTVASVEHVETILDEDRVDAYKLMALRVKITG